MLSPNPEFWCLCIQGAVRYLGGLSALYCEGGHFNFSGLMHPAPKSKDLGPSEVSQIRVLYFSMCF